MILISRERNSEDRDSTTVLNKMEGGDGPSAISSNPTAIKGNISYFRSSLPSFISFRPEMCKRRCKRAIFLLTGTSVCIP